MSAVKTNSFRSLIALSLALVVSGNCLEWQQDGAGLQSAPLEVPQKGKTGFRRVPPVESGIGFANQLDNERSIRNRNLLSGSGVAAGYIDGDGWCDLYFCGLDTGNKRYRNTGNWTLEDITGLTLINI